METVFSSTTLHSGRPGQRWARLLESVFCSLSHRPCVSQTQSTLSVVIETRAIHSYASHSYSLSNSGQHFPPWCIPLICIWSLALLRAMCHFLPESLCSHIYNPWNEQNGSENKRISRKLHPSSADCLMSICGANFKPSKSMSSLYCNLLH